MISASHLGRGRKRYCGDVGGQTEILGEVAGELHGRKSWAINAHLARYRDRIKENTNMQPQFKWQWCNKCQGLSYGNGPALGPCPAGGDHDHSGSYTYFLYHDTSITNYQKDWRWCNKCQGLTYAGSASLGSCPAGGSHDHTGSYDYAINNVGLGDASSQCNWRWCNKCQGLSYAGSEFAGPCPAGGSHDHSGSDNYCLMFSLADQFQNSTTLQDEWQWCKKCQVLTYTGTRTPGLCAAGGSHDHTGSFDYCLSHDDDSIADISQNNWKWCNKCQTIGYAGNPEPGPCPAGGNHDHTGSYNYEVQTGNADQFDQPNWRWCNKCQGLCLTTDEVGPCPAGGAHDHAGSYSYFVGFVAT